MGLFSRLVGGSRPQWIEGGLYSTPGENGGFGVLKILKTDEGGVHVRLYSNQFPDLPVNIDEAALYMAGMDRQPDETLGMGHLPVSHQSFATWNATFVQQSSITEDELEGYRMWEEAKGGYF
jgi:hypothetical protein